MLTTMAQKMCRLCCENEASSHIFNNEASDVGIYTKIIYCCSNIKIEEGDGLPSCVCSHCEQELTACYQFLLKCEDSDKKLRKYLTFVESETIDFYDLKPKAEVKDEINNDNLYDDPQYEEVANTDIELDIKIDGIRQDIKYSNEQRYNNRKPYKKGKKHKRLSSKCLVCGRLCASAASLAIHMRSHTNERPFSCPSCDKKYKDNGTLKRHMERNHFDKRQRNFICENCGKGFYSKTCVNIHMRTHTGETPFTCSQCPAKFTQLSTLLRHKRRHTGEKYNKCPTCAKQFCTKEELKIHLVVHTIEKKFICTICNANFKYKTNLRKHFRQHAEPDRFVCNYCGRTFNAKGNLKVHINRKHSEKSGRCNICSKNVSNIEAHMWRHTGERPIKCELCTSSFYELRALGHHMNFKHKKTDIYKCVVEGCSTSFPSKPMLEFHIAKFHSTNIPFPCDRCSRGFYRKSDLARHKIGTHKEKLS